MSLRFANPADAKRFRAGDRMIEPKRSRLARLWQWVKLRFDVEPCVTVTKVNYETGEVEVRAGR